MADVLKYSEASPVSCGWYWRRTRGVEEIIKIDILAEQPWQERMQAIRRIAAVNPSSKHWNDLASQPDNFFKIEWAGPIENPLDK